MPSVEIFPRPTNTSHARTHLWYSHGRTLYRRNVATNVTEKLHVFPIAIRHIRTHGDRCVVATGNMGKYTLWWGEAPWTRIANRIKYWHLTPTSVVHGDLVTSKTWDFPTVTNVSYDDYFLASYWTAYRSRSGWLQCGSRTRVRLERLLQNNTVVAQLVRHKHA